jgi:hypothetical protein
MIDHRRSGGSRSRQPGYGRSEKAVQAGVGRHEDEIMGNRKPEVPYEQFFYVAAAEDPVEHERDDREAGEVS